MKNEIIICGVGGQGVVSIAQIIAKAAASTGKYIRQSEVHGMAQRGAAVFSHMRISDSPIYSDIIPHGHADLIISMEPMETLRYVRWLKENTQVFVSAKPIETLLNYPDEESLKLSLSCIPNCRLFYLDSRARELGNSRYVNMIMLGIITHMLPFSQDVLEVALKTMFSGKRQKFLGKTLEALHLGMKLV